ncbi:endonuclease III domain-containing protein, partial [Spirochaetota bacterium]
NPVNKIEKIYRILYKHYGPQGWWPLSMRGLVSKHHAGSVRTMRDRTEVIIGAILTQNTAWTNVEKALYNLNNADIRSFQKITKTPHQTLARLIHPSGFFNQKALRLKIISKFFSPKTVNTILHEKDITVLRSLLLGVKGIGDETCDSILLYAFSKNIFVIDAYTKRIFSRVGLLKENSKYNAWQLLFMKSLMRIRNKSKVFSEYHALIVEHAKQYCRKKQICKRCPIQKLCSHYTNTIL